MRHSGQPIPPAVVQAIVMHLQNESRLLNAVVEASKLIRGWMQPPAKSNSNGSPDDNSSTSETDIPGKLDRLKAELQQFFLPVQASRRELAGMLRSFPSRQGGSARLRDLLPAIPESQRGELQRLRMEIREKLNDYQAISMSNQAVLVYTQDFYQRFLMGISGTTATTASYDAQGNKTTAANGPMIQTDC